MHEEFDLLDLADEIAEIARVTVDPRTARQLLHLVSRILARAGLAGLDDDDDDDGDGGGDEPPGHLASEAARS